MGSKCFSAIWEAFNINYKFCPPRKLSLKGPISMKVSKLLISIIQQKYSVSHRYNFKCFNDDIKKVTRNR